MILQRQNILYQEPQNIPHDTTTMVETLLTAAEQVEAVLPAGAGIAEVVGDKGYHSNETMVAFADAGKPFSPPASARRPPAP